jgi:hypothetical protein
MAESSRLMTQYLKQEIISKQKNWNPVAMLITYVIVIGIAQFIAGFFDVKISLQTPFIIVLLGGILYLYFLILSGPNIESFVNLLKNRWFVIMTIIILIVLIWTSYNTEILPPLFQAIKGP